MKSGLDRLRAFRLCAILALLALTLEFILGMYSAFFVAFPESLANGNAWTWAMSGSAVVLAHIVVGSLLLALSLGALAYALVSRNVAAIITAALGLVMVGIAYMAGSIFLSDIEMDTWSFTMSLGFIGAMLAYGLAWHLADPRRLAAAG